jgi:hypothetical protein
MPLYRVFGGILATDLDFPELAPCQEGKPSWRLTLHGSAALPSDSHAMGEDVVWGDVRVRTYRHGGGFSMSFDDTGRFDVSADGTQILWHCGGRASPEGRADVLGRVLPLALHAAGILSLHASAVSFGDAAVAFLAPKYHGKSTIATALVEQGARLVTDDILPIRIADPPMCLPGVQQLRLFHDSAEATVQSSADPERSFDRKVTLSLATSASRVQGESVRLAAAYLLTPVESLPSGEVVRRERIDSIGAAMSLVQHSKIGPLLSSVDAGAMFLQAASLADVVPVYDLFVVRDLEVLSDVATTISSWHRTTA